MIERKTLTLILTSEWYDLIHSGYKKEEYREIKPYYDSRFIGRTYKEVVFINGYHPDARRMCFKVKKILRTTGRPEWGGDKKEITWVIRLGDKLWGKDKG